MCPLQANGRREAVFQADKELSQCRILTILATDGTYSVESAAKPEIPVYEAHRLLVLPWSGVLALITKNITGNQQYLLRYIANEDKWYEVPPIEGCFKVEDVCVLGPQVFLFHRNSASPDTIQCSTFDYCTATASASGPWQSKQFELPDR